jgi:hypothetical protein
MTDDQKRALGIGGVGIAGFLLYRHLHSSGTSLIGGTATPNTSGLTSGAVGGSVAPYTPQTPIPLPPGESVYDPNSEALLNTPTAYPAPQPAAAQADTAAAPAYQVNVNYPHSQQQTAAQKAAFNKAFNKRWLAQHPTVAKRRAAASAKKPATRTKAR